MKKYDKNQSILWHIYSFYDFDEYGYHDCQNDYEDDKSYTHFFLLTLLMRLFSLLKIICCLLYISIGIFYIILYNIEILSLPINESIHILLYL